MTSLDLKLFADSGIVRPKIDKAIEHFLLDDETLHTSRDFDMIAHRVPELRVLERRDPQKQEEYFKRCNWYVFEHVYGEDSSIISENLMYQPVSALVRYGYSPLQIEKESQLATLEDKDVICYRGPLRDAIVDYQKGYPTAYHWGIWDKGAEKVISKFYSGHVYIHKINHVPTPFGDEVLFFRKNNKNI